jgi:lipid II:glycine glycyltransferase (peptidoglycan interpeptide bridge formation enzyme)
MVNTYQERKATINLSEDQTWDAFVKSHEQGHILQSAEWAAFKESFGWKSQRCTYHEDGEIVGGASILYRAMHPRFPWLGKLAYIPRGPLLNWEDTSRSRKVISQIKGCARRHGASVLKIEPNIRDSAEVRAVLKKLDFRESVQTVQPPRTILIDLKLDEEDILAEMKQKTRYNIRLSKRKGVTLRYADPHHPAADLDTFNAMMCVTGSRSEDYAVHAPDYYAEVFASFAPIGHAALIFAEFEDDPLAAVMVFRWGEKAWYLYGASSNRERNRMPTYAVQWESIRWAKQQGCTVYDMWGVPDRDEVILEDAFTERGDGLWGVYRFKRGWGGEVVRFAGTWDMPLDARYWIYKLALNFREV